MRIGLALTMLAATLVGASAQTFERISDYEDALYGNRVFVSGDYDTMRAVRTYWQRESQRLHHLRGCEFSLCGNGDAILRVSIPTRLLFLPGDTLLTPQADASLRPFLHLVRGAAPLASLIVTCHSDNNGSLRYLTEVTEARARNVRKWMERQGAAPAKTYAYGVADRCPRANNETLANRERNRRMTLYFIPSREMLKQAKRGKLGAAPTK